MIKSKKFYVYFCTMKTEVCPTENEVNKLISCIIKKWGDSVLLLLREKMHEHLWLNTGMDQTVSRGWFFPRAPSCTKQQVTGRAELGGHHMPRLGLVGPRLDQISKRLSSHGVPSNCAVATPLAPVLPEEAISRSVGFSLLPALTRENTAPQQHCPLQAGPEGVENATRQHSGGCPGGPFWRLAPSRLLSHPTNHAGLSCY